MASAEHLRQIGSLKREMKKNYNTVTFTINKTFKIDHCILSVICTIYQEITENNGYFFSACGDSYTYGVIVSCC